MLRTYAFFLLIAAFAASFLSSGSDPVAERPNRDERKATSASPIDEASEGSYDADNSNVVEIERSADGHFYADAVINGTQVHILVDTGATGIALTRDDAHRVGLPISPRMDAVIGRGPSGDVYGEYVQLDRISLGNTSAEGMPAVVLDTGHQSLLGQSFLQGFDSVEIRGDKMLLR